MGRPSIDWRNVARLASEIEQRALTPDDRARVRCRRRAVEILTLLDGATSEEASAASLEPLSTQLEVRS